ncbi:MAG: hypothetical protein LBL46_01335 [Rickettsiales bacterium]|jgi:cell division protein FtsX|nr:hypothetical protein [Rickettsiales bacterium]
MARGGSVFSFVDDQRRFLFALIGFLTFLIALTAGVAMSTGGAVGRLDADLARTGILQGDAAAMKKLVIDAGAQIESAEVIDKKESEKLLSAWIKNADALAGYIPAMTRVKAANAAGLDAVAKRAEAAKLRFTYGRGAAPDRAVGIKIILLAAVLFALVLGALGLIIIHSVKNIILIHAREIGILNQVGATNGYIARQIQKAMLKISLLAATAGAGAACVFMLLVNGLSARSRTGLLANMSFDGGDALVLAILAAVLVAAISIAAGRTTTRILK